MSETHPEPVKLAEYPNEAAAAIEKGVLEAEGIRAWTTGALTSGMRAEAPGVVGLFVQAPDESMAKEILAVFRDVE